MGFGYFFPKIRVGYYVLALPLSWRNLGMMAKFWQKKVNQVEKLQICIKSMRSFSKLNIKITKELPKMH